MSDPFSGGFDPRMFANVPLFRELAKVMSWTGGPVNWELASDTALSIAAPPGALSGGTERDTAEFSQAVDVAELWLDQVTAVAAVDGPARALGAAEWTRLATSSSGLGVYVEPVAQGMGGALAKGLPPGMEALGGQLNQALNSMGAMLFGVQIGTVAGHLAGQLFGVYDLGVPTVEPRTVGTVSDTALRFSREYQFDILEFRYWLALREASHRRVYAGVSWLRPLVGDLIGQFAAEADLDIGAMLEGMGGTGFDPSDPSAIEAALSGPEAFRVEPTTAQHATLRRLQALVAFVESWSDTVVEAAADSRLTSLPRITEAVRRRRAERGPGEQFLQQLLGLDLKPGDLRGSRAFCDAIVAARGQEGLDRAWGDAANLPRPDELADPSRWLLRMAAMEIDAEISAGGPDAEASPDA